MAEHRTKNLDHPDEVIRFGGLTVRLVEIGDITVGHLVTEPGWRWSKDVRPIVGGDWCQARHVGIILAGRVGILLSDGTEFELGPDDVFDVPPGHDGWTIGDEPCIQIEWAGLRTFAGAAAGFHNRVLATLLFTDLVDSTPLAARLGDRAWRELLSRHLEAARVEIERYRGREISTTGDGLLARFDAPQLALRCAAAIQAAARRDDLELRAGVHVGEVELVGAAVRGVTVHEAARITAQAGPNEILVSETTRALAKASGLSFEDRGVHTLKGLEGDWLLSRYVPA